MKRIFKKIYKCDALCFFIIIFLFYTFQSYAQDGKEIFSRDCNACHTIGEGQKVGPDLKNVTKRRNINWLSKFINASADMIAAKDPDATAIFNKFNKIPMPPHTLTPSEIKALLDYINNPNAAASGSTSNAAPLFTPNPESGRDLFTGKHHLEHGGPACISCHSVRADNIFAGGTLARDLTTAYELDIVDSVLSVMPAMKCSYKNHEVTFTEKSNIEAFLQIVREKQVYAYPKMIESFLILWGTIISVLILLVYLLFFKSKTSKF